MAHVVPCSPARLTLLLPANKMMTEAGSLLFANFANKFANMCFNLQTINIFYKYKVVFCLFRNIIYIMFKSGVYGIWYMDSHRNSDFTQIATEK